MRTKGIILALCLMAGFDAYSQDVHFSQYTATPMLINPALTGDFLGTQRAGVANKDQWRSVTSPYKTMHAFIDAAFNEARWNGQYFGMGIDFYRDVAGDANMGTTKFGFGASYAKSLSYKSLFSFGAQLGIMQKTLDFSELTWDNQFDGVSYNPNLSSREPNNNINFIKPDLSAGATWNYNISELSATRFGLAMFHINSPILDFYPNSEERVGRRFVFHADARFEEKNSNVAYLPKILYQRQNSLSELLFGGMIEYKLQEGSRITGWITETTVSFGLLHRWNDAIVFVTQFYMKNFDLGISYDINVSKLATVSNHRGGVELTLVYTTPFVSRWRKGASRSRY